MRPSQRPLFQTLVALLVAATPVMAVAAQSDPAAADDVTCRPVTFIGIHGLGEGPTESATVLATLRGYIHWGTAHNGGPLTEYRFVEYPKWEPDAFVARPQESFDVAVRALSKQILLYNKTCESTVFVLVGYSLGAWAITELLDTRLGVGLSRKIVGVLLMGDPRWADEKRNDHGLGWLLPRDVMYNSQYPPLIDRTRSLCAERDPICGAGFGSDPLAQATAAKTAADSCGASGIGPHLCYQHSVAGDGGAFLAEKAVQAIAGRAG